MNENLRQSRFILLMRQVWPYINRILNSIFYFIVGIIRTFFKYAVQMIKGKY